jgi:hypothetical protein
MAHKCYFITYKDTFMDHLLTFRFIEISCTLQNVTKSETSITEADRGDTHYLGTCGLILFPGVHYAEPHDQHHPYFPVPKSPSI